MLIAISTNSYSYMLIAISTNSYYYMLIAVSTNSYSDMLIAIGTCITSRWTLAQGRSDRCTVKAGSMVKHVALSLLALIPFLSITG